MNKLPITICLFISFLLTSCLKDNGEIFQRYDVVYADEKVNKDSLDFYFSENKEKYPSYEESKKNVPNLLDGVKYIKTNLKTMKVLKFNDNPIGFLSGTSFLCFNYNYYYLSSGFGGYGLTEFVIKRTAQKLGCISLPLQEVAYIGATSEPFVSIQKNFILLRT